MSCEQCASYFKKKRLPTPCGPCKKVYLLPTNEDVWAIFLELTSQARVGGFGGVFGFEYTALPIVFQLHCVPEEYWHEYYIKLHRTWVVAMKHWNKKEEKKPAANKSK